MIDNLFYIRDFRVIDAETYKNLLHMTLRLLKNEIDSVQYNNSIRDIVTNLAKNGFDNIEVYSLCLITTGIALTFFCIALITAAIISATASVAACAAFLAIPLFFGLVFSNSANNFWNSSPQRALPNNATQLCENLPNLSLST